MTKGRINRPFAVNCIVLLQYCQPCHVPNMLYEFVEILFRFVYIAQYKYSFLCYAVFLGQRSEVIGSVLAASFLVNLSCLHRLKFI